LKDREKKGGAGDGSKRGFNTIDAGRRGESKKSFTEYRGALTRPTWGGGRQCKKEIGGQYSCSGQKGSVD